MKPRTLGGIVALLTADKSDRIRLERQRREDARRLVKVQRRPK